jgi:flagellar secretion chaperone FliS
MTPSDIKKEYLASRVSAATPMELTRMLYEGALQSVAEAIAAHRAGDILARGNAVTKTVQILGELRFSLRREVNPQYCDTLAGLYGYLQRRLIQAHAEKSESMLREVQGLVQTLLDGWIGAMDNFSSAGEGAPEAVGPSADPGSASALSASNPYSPDPHASDPGAPRNRSWQF